MVLQRERELPRLCGGLGCVAGAGNCGFVHFCSLGLYCMEFLRVRAQWSQENVVWNQFGGAFSSEPVVTGGSERDDDKSCLIFVIMRCQSVKFVFGAKLALTCVLPSVLVTTHTKTQKITCEVNVPAGFFVCEDDELALLLT